MLSIQFRMKKRLNYGTKFEIIDKILKLLKVERREIYYSDYTFSEVEESRHIEWLENTILDKDKWKELNSKNYFVTIVAVLPDTQEMLIHVIPQRVRNLTENCSHVDFLMRSGEPTLAHFRGRGVLHKLEDVLDSYRDMIAEFYFYDLSQGPDCYTDLEKRSHQKIYDPILFAELISHQVIQAEDMIERNTRKINSQNFAKILLSEEAQPKLQHLISQQHLDVAVSSGSIAIHGSDSARFVQVLKELFVRYNDSLLSKNIYQQEFERLFQK